MKLHRTQDIPGPAERVMDVPEALRRFIIKACRRDPDKRYQSLQAALEDLRPLAGAIGLRYHHPMTAARRTTTLVLSHHDGNLDALQQLLEKFGQEAKELAVDLRNDFIVRAESPQLSL